MVRATLKRWFTQIKGGAIHPLILPVFPVLSLYLSNLGQGFLSKAAPILSGVFVLSLVSWALIYALMKDRNKSALIVSTFFVLFFSFGHGLAVLRLVLEQVNLLDKLWFVLYARHARLYWAVSWVILFIGLTLLIVKPKCDVKKRTDGLNFMAVTLAVIAVGNFFIAGGFRLHLRPLIGHITSPIQLRVSTPQAKHQPEMEYHAYLPLVSTSDSPNPTNILSEQIWLRDFPEPIPPHQQRPDIYYIVPDTYIRADYLTELYQCDTSDFLSFLEERGFYIADESRSNYHMTFHSLASSLNYMYINELAEQTGYMGKQEITLSAQMTLQNRVTTYLEAQGYTTIAFATGYWFTEFIDADIYMESPALAWTPGEFEAGVIRLTPLSAFSIFDQSFDETHRRRTLYTLQHIPDATRIDTPAFVFAHLIAPHGPFVFDAYGGPIASRQDYTYEEYTKIYCDQVLHINWRLQEVVDRILTRSSKPSIIIIQSDHGAIYGNRYADPEQIHKRMAILNAYYFPDQDYTDLYPGITPVNTFRVVLNNYFGTDYALLDDLSYSILPTGYYDFVDVTSKVIDEQPAP